MKPKGEKGNSTGTETEGSTNNGGSSMRPGIEDTRLTTDGQVRGPELAFIDTTKLSIRLWNDAVGR